MRTHTQIIACESILQALKDSGCPVCRLLKEYQAARLQNHSKENTHRLCNLHIIDNYRKELTQELKHLRDEPEPDRTGWVRLGVLPGSSSRSAGYIPEEDLC